ncbi:Hsp20/alpha crystallin family protein [Patescibacteria group bacterium]|nr:Hsp20/alpha crystallin family protein [Patescibacteria group bacterium]
MTDIIRFEPFRGLDRFFEDDFLTFPWRRGRASWDLAVDIFEEGKNVIAKMQIPGIDPEKLDIHIEDNHLSVSGSREEEHEVKKKNYYSKQIQRGSFSRVIPLPAAVQAEKIEAKCENGVLTITVPKKEVSGKDGKKVKVKIKK